MSTVDTEVGEGEGEVVEGEDDVVEGEDGVESDVVTCNCSVTVLATAVVVT